MNVKIITTKGDLVFDQIDSYLKEAGIVCSEFSRNDARNLFQDSIPQIVLLDMTGPIARPSFVKEIIDQSKDGRLVGVLGVISKRDIGNVDYQLGLDDFLLSPIDYDELLTRLNMLSDKYSTVGENSNMIKVEALVIDTAR